MVNSKIEKITTRSFPALYQNQNGEIVLFSNDNWGTCIHSSNTNEMYVGLYSESWITCHDSQYWRLLGSGEIVSLNND